MNLRNRILSKQRNVLAFGVEPSTRRYRMGSAKYADMGRLIHKEQATKGSIKLLDIGCGDGKLILYARHPSIEFTGFDVFVHTSAESARSRGYAKLQEGNVRGEQLSTHGFRNEKLFAMAHRLRRSMSFYSELRYA